MWRRHSKARGGGRDRRLLRVIPADARTRTCSPCCVVVALGGATGTAHPRAGSAGRARPSRSLAHIQATQVARTESTRPRYDQPVSTLEAAITASYVSRNTTHVAFGAPVDRIAKPRWRWVRIGHAKRTSEFYTWEMRLKKNIVKKTIDDVGCLATDFPRWCRRACAFLRSDLVL